MITDHPSVFKRLLAMAYDSILVATVMFIGCGIILFFNKGQAISQGTIWFQIYLIGIWMLFCTWFWVNGGQTIGLRAWKLKIVDYDNKTITWTQAVLRFLIPIITVGISFAWCFIDKDSQALHDRLAKTKIIRV